MHAAALGATWGWADAGRLCRAGLRADRGQGQRGEPMQGYDHVVRPKWCRLSDGHHSQTSGGTMILPKLHGPNRTAAATGVGGCHHGVAVFRGGAVLRLVLPGHGLWRHATVSPTRARSSPGSDRSTCALTRRLEPGMPWEFKPVVRRDDAADRRNRPCLL